MGLIDFIADDIKSITQSSNDFGLLLEFTAPNGTTASINGLATRHHFSLTTDGLPVNSRNVHCSFSESALAAKGYPIRINGEVNLRGHLVAWTDNTGTKKTYVVNEWFPDDLVGLIVCLLGDYKNA